MILNHLRRICPLLVFAYIVLVLHLNYYAYDNVEFRILTQTWILTLSSQATEPSVASC